MTIDTQALRALMERALADDGDHMIASGDDLVWLAAQLANWPMRVHPENTTNQRFLMCSAAATLAAQAGALEAAQARLAELEKPLRWLREFWIPGSKHDTQEVQDALAAADAALEPPHVA